MRRVVVTGLGAVTPIGNTVSEMWQGVKEGRCGIAPITLYDTEGRKVTLAGEVKDFRPEERLDKREVRKMDRFTQFAVAAAAEALGDAGIGKPGDETEDRSRYSVIVSSGIGGIGTIEKEDHRGEEKGYDRVSPFFIPMSISNMAAAHIAIAYGFQGMCSCVVSACASGANAIGDGFHQIRDGYADVCVCGGAEASITPLSIGGFTSMNALCTETDPNRASIPFDADRSGFVMGEGAGILVLEEYEHAVARGAKIYCEVAGYGTNCDAYHITAPSPDGKGAAGCMQTAMSDAGIAPEEIAYINAHGTSTKLNDMSETKAIRLAFGEHADHLCVSSTKSMTGHLLGASGAVEGVITALAVHDDFAPATIHYEKPDEDCDLDIVANTGRETVINCAMSNSLGFGGHNVSLVFRKTK